MYIFKIGKRSCVPHCFLKYNSFSTSWIVYVNMRHSPPFHTSIIKAFCYLDVHAIFRLTPNIRKKGWPIRYDASLITANQNLSSDVGCNRRIDKTFKMTSDARQNGGKAHCKCAYTVMDRISSHLIGPTFVVRYGVT